MSEDKDIDAADWVDQDLLTRDEAGERLIGEIEHERKKLQELEATTQNPDSIALVKRRLIAMENLRDSL